MLRRTAMIATACLALTGCGGADAAAPKAKTVTVNFHLADYDTAYFQCQGAGGYSDIGPGTTETNKNGDGKVLGAKSLGTGKSSTNGRQAAFCDWTVRIPGVPAGEKFYSTEVGSRGAVTSSAADLAKADWTVNVSLGD
jgi:hypothetical protein